MSTHADTAKAIRKELKKVFPLTQFFVTSKTFSMGDSVAISWFNGTPSEKVSAIVNKYQYGHLNGMEDIYENTNSRSDIPQVKYVQVRREVSEDIQKKVFEYLKRTHNGFELLLDKDHFSQSLWKCWNCGTARQYIYRILVNEDLTHGYKEKEAATHSL